MHVYRFDCFDSNSLKPCYIADHPDLSFSHSYYAMGDVVISTSSCLDLDNDVELIYYDAWKFTDVDYTKVGEWKLPLDGGYTQIVKLSDDLLLSMAMNDSNQLSYLTTISHDGKTTFSSQPVTPTDLIRMGFEMVAHCMWAYVSTHPNSIRYHTNHHIVLRCGDSCQFLYKHSMSKPIATFKSERLLKSIIIDGKMRLTDGSMVDLNSKTLVVQRKFTAPSYFFAHASKKRIEQIYLPLLLPVFKGCKDLALLVASYLEWDNDVVN